MRLPFANGSAAAVPPSSRVQVPPAVAARARSAAAPYSAATPPDATLLVCPKCQGAMRTYERSGVVIDQCTDCRGFFFDYGEVERLIDAERMGARESDRGVEAGRVRRQREYIPDVGVDNWRGRDSRSCPAGGDRSVGVVR